MTERAQEPLPLPKGHWSVKYLVGDFGGRNRKPVPYEDFIEAHRVPIATRTGERLGPLDVFSVCPDAATRLEELLQAGSAER